MGFDLASFLGIGKTVADVTDKATNGIANIITTAKGDIPPEAKGEIEKLKIEIGGDIEKIVQTSVDKAREFAIRYEGSAEQIPKWLLVVRSLIRPLITIFTFGWFGAFVTVDLINIFKRTDDYTMILIELPSGFWWIMGVILTFWFGGKVGERVAAQIRKPVNPE